MDYEYLLNKRIGTIFFIFMAALLLQPNVVYADTGEKNALSQELTTLYRSARAVISKNQKHINDPAVGDKGLSGSRGRGCARRGLGD